MADQPAIRLQSEGGTLPTYRAWTALFTLAGLGAASVYKPEFAIIYLNGKPMGLKRGS